MIKDLCFVLFFCVATLRAYATPILPINLRCEYRVNPLGIDTKTPRFSWEFDASVSNERQTAYQISISRSPAGFDANATMVWNSGVVASSKSTHIEYTGPKLESFQRYYWRVSVTNSKNETKWSDVAWFETAFTAPKDWKGLWINDGKEQPERDEDYYNQKEGMPLFKKVFTAKKAPVSARLYIVGLGYYEASLNGGKIGENVLDPGWTSYKNQVLYSTYDITKQIKAGSNTIGVMLGNGWWNPLPIKLFGRWDIREYQQTGRPCVKAEVHLTYDDNTVEIIPTDATWQTVPGPVMQNSVYLGEHYDARLEKEGWNVSSTGTGWKNASVGTGPSGLLSAQMQPSIKVIEIVKPIKITSPAADTFIVDMGKNFAGVARIKVKGKAGTQIRIRYGEDIYKNGKLNYSTGVMTQIRKGGIKGGPGAPETAWQEDVYTLKGKGLEAWAPRFTFHSFRYIEITGWPGKPTLDNFEGLLLSAEVVEDGQFTCSNNMLNELQDVIKRTFRSNVFSVQSDCPAREKLGYGADMVVTANAFIYNYDMSTFYSKAVRDFANDQQPDGGITEIAPFVGIADRGYGGYSGPLGWQLGYPFLQKQLYDFYGDRRTIEENYERVEKQMEFLKSKAVEGLFHWDIGDHEALDPRAEAFSAAAFYYHHALLASEFAGILEKKDDAIKYASLADNIKSLIVRKYLVPGTGKFDNATQAAQIFALWYKLTPEEEKTFKVLMDEFARHKDHVSTGIFSTKMMFDVLREKNQNELAYRIATQKDFPGWGNMLANGATTLWETWAYPETYPSQNHPMFGSISEWFYRSLLGINPAAPGFEKIIIKPQPAGDLTFAKGAYHSVKGVIESSWRIDKKSFTLAVSIPANTSAEVWVPVKENSSVSSMGKVVDNVTYKEGYAIINIGSGQHNFSSQFK